MFEVYFYFYLLDVVLLFVSFDRLFILFISSDLFSSFPSLLSSVLWFLPSDDSQSNVVHARELDDVEDRPIASCLNSFSMSPETFKKKIEEARCEGMKQVFLFFYSSSFSSPFLSVGRYIFTILFESCIFMQI